MCLYLQSSKQEVEHQLIELNTRYKEVEKQRNEKAESCHLLQVSPVYVT